MKIEHRIAIVVRWLSAFVIALLAVTGILYNKVEAADPVITGAPPTGYVGTPYSYSFSATGDAGCCSTATWSISGLPPGLTASGRTISGTPTAAGTYTAVDVTINDPTGTTTTTFTIIISVPPITFSTTSIPSGTVGQSYAASIIATGGTGTITYSIISGTLPPGLIFNAGQLTGTPSRNSAGTYSFTVQASSGTVSAQQTYSTTVERGTFSVTVTISPTLAEGQTRLYVNNQPRGSSLSGGDSVKLTGLDPDAAINVSVDDIVQNPSRPDIRYNADASSATASEDSTLISFTYRTEYSVDLRSEPAGITSISGSGWYREGVPINLTAPNEVPKDNDSQYRFAYWLTPSGEKINSQVLNTAINAPGKFIATYDLYYKVDVETQYGSFQGGGWQKSGSMVKWSVSPGEVPMTGVLGFFGGKQKALITSGSVTVDSPKTITVQWDPDYTTPAITIPLALVVVAGIVYGLYSLTRGSRRPEPVPYGPSFNAPPPSSSHTPISYLRHAAASTTSTSTTSYAAAADYGGHDW